MLSFPSLFSRPKRFDYKGLTDWHCHILPGVDDGVEDMETALAILGEYERIGIREVWLTPHIMEDVPNSTSRLKERHEDLLSAYQGRIIIRLASENMIDSLFQERLAQNDILPIGHKHNMLLVETSTFNAPIDFEDTLIEIRRKGYYPLLAHPERYAYIQNIRDYQKLKDIGILFQLNLLSLTGYYGKIAMHKSHKMLKNGMYDVFGTDLHRPEQLLYLNQLSLTKKSSHSLHMTQTNIS